MADKEEATAEDEGGGGGKGGLMGMLLTALVAAAAGGAGVIGVQKAGLLPGEAPAEGAAAEAEAAAEPANDASSATSFQERLLTLDPVVVNIAGNNLGRFLKITIELEADSVQAKEELMLRQPQVRDAIITLVSSKRISDLTDFEGKALLKEDLRERIGQVIASGGVTSVMFTEFVVQ